MELWVEVILRVSLEVILRKLLRHTPDGDACTSAHSRRRAPERKKERKQTTQGRDGRTVHRHHTGISRRGQCGASRHLPLGACLFLSLFAVCRRFSLQPSCHPAVFLLSSFSLPSLLPLSLRSPLPRSAAPLARTILLTPTPIICRHVKLLLRSTLSSITCTFTDGVGTGVPLMNVCLLYTSPSPRD